MFLMMSSEVCSIYISPIVFFEIFRVTDFSSDSFDFCPQNSKEPDPEDIKWLGSSLRALRTTSLQVCHSPILF